MEMKNIWKAVLAFMVSISFVAEAGADEYSDIMREANDLYAAEEFQQALDKYKEIEQAGMESSALYYNMGNSYFRLSDAGNAILYYERSLRLDPSNRDIQTNLEMARQYTTDRIEQVPEFVMLSWGRNLRTSVSANAWAWISIIFLAVAAVLLLLYFYGKTSSIRKICFIFSMVCVLLFLVSMGFSLSQRQDILNDDYAIVMAEVSSVRGAPDDSAKGLFVLHEGTKLTVIENIGNWSRVELSDGRQGWILSEEIEII